MTPTTFGEIQRIARLAVLQPLFASIVEDDAPTMPGLKKVALTATLDGDTVYYSVEYYGPNGQQLGELGL